MSMFHLPGLPAAMVSANTRRSRSFGRLGRQDTATVFRKLDRQLVVTERTLRTAAVDQHLVDHPSSVLRRHGQDRRCLLREDGVAARVAGPTFRRSRMQFLCNFFCIVYNRLGLASRFGINETLGFFLPSS